MTRSVTVVLWLLPPPVAVTVTVNVPRVLPVDTRSSVAAAPPGAGVTDAGENVPLAPDGSPLTLNVTGDEKPPVDVTVTVNSLLLPARVNVEVGLAVIV